MSKFYVEYKASVFVTVEDDEDGELEVTAVNIADEDLAQTGVIFNESWRQLDPDDDETWNKVTDAATDDGTWPVWEMGW